MMKISEKQTKIVSIIVGLLFIGSVVAIALTQNGSVSAASNGSVGVIDYNQVMTQHPDLENIKTQMQTAVADVRKEFEEKSAGMNDQEKQDYYMQSQERLRQKQQELMDPVEQSIKDAVKKTADKKGLSVVIDKMTVVYGGVDITQDVITSLSKK